MKKTFTLSILILGFVCHTIAQPDFQWARQFGGTENDFGQSIAVDAAGNVYTTGYFQGTADFDPGAGTYNLTSAGDWDIFISKLDAAGNFAWAKRLGGTGTDWGLSIAVDAAGNVYTTGSFEGTADFDPGAGGYNLTSAGSSDIFISKLDASGNFIWAKRIGGNATGADQGKSITTDATGNIYIAGRFYGVTVDFDPGAGTYNLTSAGKFDAFILKLDAPGNFVWAKQFGGTGSEEINSIVLDASGNIYTTGQFEFIVDFDPGAGGYNLNSPNGLDAFVSKLDASGNFVWAKQFSGTSAASDQGYSIAVDAAGNVYTTGHFQLTVDFDPGGGTYNFTSAGSFDAFISKLDAAGNFVWAKQFGGPSNRSDQGLSIALDASGNVYTTGQFSETVDFDPGAGTYNLTSAGKDEGFICKLDASGNFAWAVQLGGAENDKGYSLAVDASGNVYTVGYFQSTPADFDPGTGTYNLTSAGLHDIFVHKLGSCAGSSSITITALRDTICAGTPGILNVTANPGIIQWQSSVTAGNFTSITGATGISYISQDTTTTYFRAYSSGVCGTDTSAAFQLVVKPSPIADFTTNGSAAQITFTDKSKGATVYNWDFGDNATSTEQNPVHTYASTGTYHVCLTVFNGSNCSFTTCRDLNVDVVTGVTAIRAENHFVLYPNPFSHSITIEQRQLNNSIERIEIYDLLGRKVYSAQLQTSLPAGQAGNLKLQTEIDLSGLASGMYFVKVKTKNAEEVPLLRLIKN